MQIQQDITCYITWYYNIDYIIDCMDVSCQLHGYYTIHCVNDYMEHQMQYYMFLHTVTPTTTTIPSSPPFHRLPPLKRGSHGPQAQPSAARSALDRHPISPA
jgi:hypothetical protein